MASQFGKHIITTIFGESHGAAVGVTIDNLPAGEPIDIDAIQVFLARRAGGKSYTTQRKEPDELHILSGIYKGRTTGSPVAVYIENTDKRSSDYDSTAFLPRPAHADFPAGIKYGGYNDKRGGGHFSGRLTAPLCIAGSICEQILSRRGVSIGAHVFSIADISDDAFDPVSIETAQLTAPRNKEFPTISDAAGEKMRNKIKEAAQNLDSVGGIVECAVVGLSAGSGSPLFDGIENRLAYAVFGIGAVRGIEFGAGFAATRMYGSEHNDAFYSAQTESGLQVKTKSNNHGGVLGGITTGMPLLFRVAFKPTPSIAREQDTVDLSSGVENAVNAKLVINGRHDPCIVPRAVPVVEAVTAVTLLDVLEE